MKNFTLLFTAIIGVSAFIFLNFQLPNQNNPQKDQLAEIPFQAKTTKGWFTTKNNHRISVTELTKNYKKELGFSKYDQLELKKSETDRLGITHYRYDQYHRGVRIEGGEFFVQEKDGEATNFHGMWVKDMDHLASPSYSPHQIVQRAMQILPAKKYAWQDPLLEREYKKDQNDINASRYPKPELVWIDPTFSQNKDLLQLAYKVTLIALDPLIAEVLFIDAQNGNLITYETLVTDANSVGTAITRYYGSQTIITDSVGANNYRLIENDRPSSVGPAVDIVTYDFNKNNNSFDFSSAELFTDTDNFWNNINPEGDEYATDLHLGAGLAFDYVTQNLDWNGINNGGLPYRSYAHYDDNVENAFYVGNLDRAFFGDGDPETNSTPLTSVEIVAHEFGHGIINYTAQLRYQRESGALNESFADLFGIATEFMAFPDADWEVGDLVRTDGSFFRSMANPKDRFNPDTYGGQYWYNPECENPNNDPDSDTGPNDYCGVHTNSGVQNKWFYLLSEGGTGTNDNDFTYDIPAIGMDKAMKIAFRNLRFYLGQDSKHVDALQGSLTAAEDLYGLCSPEYVAVANAWLAVGVGDGLFDNDLSLSEIVGYEAENCGLSEEEFPTVKASFPSCNPNTLAAGSTIPFAAQVDNGSITLDTLTLNTSVSTFDEITFTFSKPVSGLETTGAHTLKIWTDLMNDTKSENDTLSFTMITILDQNTDFKGDDTAPLTSDCFLTSQPVSATFEFLGCDMIAAGASVDLYYSVNGSSPVKETITLANDLARYETFSHTFSTPLDLSTTYGLSNINFWIDLNGDFINENDSIVAIAVNPVHLEKENLISFEAGIASQDSFHLQTTAFSDAYPGTYSKFDEPNIIEMTGGDYLNSGANVPNVNNVWFESNKELSAHTCICVDATGVDQLDFSFDLYQSYSRMWQALYGTPNPHGSAARVTVDGTQIGDTFFPETLTGDDVVNRTFNLDAYANTVFEVCIESRCGFSPETDQFNRGDLVRVDNLLLTGRTVSTDDLNGIRGLKVYPNPTSGMLTITYPENQQQLQLNVYDIYGRLIDSWSDQWIERGTINLSELNAGTYYLQFTDGERQSIEKVVVF